MNNSPATPSHDQTTTSAVGARSAARGLEFIDVTEEYTFDELRELPFHVQLGADFSALD